MKRTAFSAAGLLLHCVFIPYAYAQQADSASRAAAVELFDQAEKLSAAGRFAESCPKYGESYRLDPQLGAVLHLADCLEKNGQFASAYASFREAADLAQRRQDARVGIATARAKALEPRINRLILDIPIPVRVAGLQVSRDGLLLTEGSWGIPIPVDPGDHVVEAHAEGHVTYRTTVKLSGEGRTERLVIPALVASPRAPANAAPSSPNSAPAGSGSGPTVLSSASQKDANSQGNWQPTVGWVAGGVGLVGVGLGVAFSLQKGSKLSERNDLCPSGVGCAAGTQSRIDQLTSSARSAQTMASLSFVTGSLALGTSGVLLLTAPKVRSNSTAQFHVVPLLSSSGAGILAEHVF